MKKTKFIQIECTEKQALLIEIALDTLSRMTCGQLHTMIDGMDSMRGKCFKYDYDSAEGSVETISGYALGSYIEKLIKPKLFPQLYENESYGVGCKEIGDAQVAYEMVKKLQNFRVRKFPDNECGVLKHEPLHYSKEPLIKVKEL